MKFSLQWMNDFAPVKRFFEEPQLLAQKLTQAGLEVDSVEDQGFALKNIWTARIESVEKHPQADRLTVCQASTGKTLYPIVCGAKNHSKGDIAVLALPGAVLPGSFRIKKSKIRGIESQGMLCSRAELGLISNSREAKTDTQPGAAPDKEETADTPPGAVPNQEEGLWILPPDTPPGQKISEFMGSNDIVFDIAIPPNRPDLLSHRGIAREIASLSALPFAEKAIRPEGSASLWVKKSLPVRVEDPDSCPRYCGRLIEGVKIGPSAPWLKKRLESLSLKSINNVVDITNFILWDKGQPLHAFDRDKIQSLSVGLLKKPTRFVSLDDKEREITDKELVIKDGDRILALAGIIGGKDSRVTEQTTNLFIESACFAPEKIRRTARRLGLETDSSYFFARGVDFEETFKALNQACFLIQQEAGGKISKDFYDIAIQREGAAPISICAREASERLGFQVLNEDFETQMRQAGAKVKRAGHEFKVKPPSFREDLKIKEDLIEEFARREGYDKIPENPPAGVRPGFSDELEFSNAERLRRWLSARGWLEAKNYSFCDPKAYREILGERLFLDEILKSKEDWQAKKKPWLQHNNKGASSEKQPPSLNAKRQTEPALGKSAFSIENPLSERLSLMKPLLAPDLIHNMIRNFRHNNKSGQLFEWGAVFWKNAPERSESGPVKTGPQPSALKTEESAQYHETWHLGLCAWGAPLDLWQKNPAPWVYGIKSALNALFEAFSIKGLSWQKPQHEISFLHPGQSLVLHANKTPVGFLGSLHPALLKKYKIPIDSALAEADLSFLFKKLRKKPFSFKNLPALPAVEKDLCFVIPQARSAQEICREIQKSLAPACESAEPFDIYEAKDERSVSFRIRLVPQGQKAYTDIEIQELMRGAIQHIQNKFSIRLK